MLELSKNNKNPFFIAEIGINHNGDVKLAKEMIDMAVECGCNAVKFQKRDLDVVYTQEYLDSERKSPWGSTQREQKAGLEFGQTEYDEIDRYCRKKGILWSASAWDIESQKFLRRYALKFNKVASPMLTHDSFLEEVASEKLHTFISTGMSTNNHIETAIEIFQDANCPFTLLHCVSLYPCPDHSCNLRAIEFLRTRYEVPVGYSGHEAGIYPSLLAVALGATAIERHITLDRTMYGSDQTVSLEKEELKELISRSRNIEGILGSGFKGILEDELPTAKKLRYFENE